MADEPEDKKVEENDAAEAGAEGEGGKEQGEGKKSKLRLSHKKLAMLAVPLLIVISAGGYFARDYVSSFITGSSASGSKPKVYYNLPEIIVNLSSQDKSVKYLKLKVSLEARDHLVLDALNPIMPRILDMFQLYLRELRSKDLEGSAGIYRLKEELLRRINLEIHPHQISRVLFNEIIVQ